MASFNTKDILHALEVLGFTSKASIDEIIHRTHELRAEYQDAEEAEDRKRWMEIEQSSRILTEHFEYVSSLLSSDQSIPNLVSEDADKSAMANVYIDIWKTKENNKIQTIIRDSKPWFVLLFQEKKPLLISIVAGIFIVFFSIFYLPVELKYNKTESLMLEFSRNNMITLGESIDALPDNYRDVSDITSDYLTIMQHVSVLERGQLFSDYERMRESYFQLASIDDQAKDWNLSQYLNGIDVTLLVLGIEWTSPEFRLRFYTSTNPNRYRFYSNLPSERINGFQYYFFTEKPASNTNSLIIWFQNTMFAEEVFKAYRFVSATRTELVVYCYSDGKMYTLYAPQLVDQDGTVF
ncbi:MAG: hypothetical protein MZU97_23700 [Bacillus subtilis]|nr:hypothetical protein [Bacillus subtilis]